MTPKKSKQASLAEVDSASDGDISDAYNADDADLNLAKSDNPIRLAITFNADADFE
jgi:hypothetical protein